MKLYTSIGPNPHVVRMFLAEKGVEIPTQTVDIRGGENRQSEYLTKVNARGQSPALELDDGTHITEVTAICEYIDDKHPNPPLIGTTAEQRAQTRMWTRRVDLAICEPMGNGFRASEGYKMFKDRFRVLPEAADGLKAIAQDNLAWLDGEMASREFLCGDRFSMADILLYCFTNWAGGGKQPISADHKNMTAWFERMAARPSASV